MLKRFSFILLMLVMLISVTAHGQTETRELSLEEANRILADFLGGGMILIILISYN